MCKRKMKQSTVLFMIGVSCNRVPDMLSQEKKLLSGWSDIKRRWSLSILFLYHFITL